jgi:hypothetical protein
VDIAETLQGLPLPAVAAMVAGIIVLLVPRALNYAVAAYLLFVGAFGLLSWYRGGPIRAEPVVAVAAGILVLVKPQILNYVVGIYLILVGLLGAGVLRP